MSDENDVLDAATRRARALADADADALTDLLHPAFRWRTHTGQVLDRADYVERNTGGTTVWVSQELTEPEVVVVGDTAVLHAGVVDVVQVAAGPQTFRMPVTQVWLRHDGRWICLAGHAGPRLDWLGG